MRRLWMSALLAPVLALAVPGVALAAPSAPAAGAAPAVTRTLQLGMHGLSMRALQRRLAALKYYPGPIDGVFSTDTLEAVWAFQEVQGLPGEDFVSSAMQRALAHPRAPRVLDAAAGPNRVEVNLGIEVLVLYHHNQIELISHVSIAQLSADATCLFDHRHEAFAFARVAHRGTAANRRPYRRHKRAYD